MCGIAGFLGKGDAADLDQMTHALVHRGPDGKGLWIDNENHVFLGHRRLSIIDLTHGHQPMETGDQNFVIVFNGEIYNHESLRAALIKKGYRFSTHHSDTEVLLHGFREWQFELPQKLNGMWAFAIFDKARRQIFFSRDRFGKKPLYYTHQKDTFAFSSELSSLMTHKKISDEIYTLGLQKYFAYGYIPAPHTIYKNIYKLPAGHNLIVNTVTQNYQVSQYWDYVLEPETRLPKNPEDTWGEEIRFLLEQAVKRRLMSDVPLGIFLSGGIDSSSVAHYAVKSSGNDRVKTFSIGFEEDSFDESPYFTQMSQRLNTQHSKKVLSLKKAISLLPKIISMLDEPMGDASLLPTYLLCQETRKNVTVALGGDGADELFAGYDPFRALKFAEVYNRFIPKPVHQGIAMMAARLPVAHTNMSFDFKLKRTLRGLSYPKLLWNPVWLGPLCPRELADFFYEPIDIEAIYSEAIQIWDKTIGFSLIDRTLMFYTKLYLQDDILTKVDRASMMNSLEVRAPYLDIDLINLVRKIPYTYKFRHNQTKYILKKALEKVLPRNILYRQKKGFGIPIGKWFQDGMLKFNQNVQNTYFTHKFFNGRRIAHQTNREDHRAFLWNKWVFDLWDQ